MIKINLRDFYPEIYVQDVLCEVSDSVFKALLEEKKKEHAYNEKVRYHKGSYSCEVIPERYFIGCSMQIVEQMEKQLEYDILKSAFLQLPSVLRRRIFLRYFLEMSNAEIAKDEGVVRSTVSRSIQNGLHKLKEILSEME